MTWKEGFFVRYIVTLLWAFVLGQVVGYLGSALSGGQYNFLVTTEMSLLLGVIVILIANVSSPKKTK